MGIYVLSEHVNSDKTFTLSKTTHILRSMSENGQSKKQTEGRRMSLYFQKHFFITNMRNPAVISDRNPTHAFCLSGIVNEF